MNGQKSHFKDELRIVSPIAVWLAVAAFAQMQILFAMLPKGPHGLPPFPIWALISVVAGIVLAMWILLIGYINQDAKRRGMGQLLWTMIAILVPNCLGILLYFLLRKPPLVPSAWGRSAPIFATVQSVGTRCRRAAPTAAALSATNTCVAPIAANR